MLRVMTPDEALGLIGREFSPLERETERDNFLTAEEAVEYGLADKIIYNR